MQRSRCLALLLAALGLLLALPAAGQERIQGRVSAVDPGSRAPDGDLWTVTTVRVEIDGDRYPRPGDAVRFMQEVPGVGEVEVEGDWVVAGVEPGALTIVAAAADVTPLPEKLVEPVMPAVGQSAVVTSSEPFSRADLEAGVALDEAVAAGDAAAVRAALAAGALPDVPNAFGATPVAMAALAGHAEVVAALVQAGADPNGLLGRQPVVGVVATQEDSEAGVAALLAAGARADVAGAYGFTPLHFAVDPEIGDGWLNVLQLVRAGAEVDARTGADAPPYDHWGMEIQASFDRSGATPLMLAALHGREDSIRVLLAAGADPSATNGAGQTAADLARAEPSCEECLELLADPAAAAAGLGAELIDELERAITYDGNVERARLLLANGVEPQAVDSYGHGPLHWLAADPADDLPIAAAFELFVDAGVAIDAVSADGATPLMVAAADGQIEVMRLLLRAGANANFQSPGDEDGDYAGVTALMVAADNGEAEAIRVLLEAGADRSLADAEGDTAADYARGANYLDLAEMLSGS